MGHRKFPPVAFTAWQAQRGYLYAIPVWDCPGDDGKPRLSVKLGSTRDLDPVGSLRFRNDTILGHTRVWWLCPSADAYRDERHRLHQFFADRRRWADREHFSFAKAEFEECIHDFERVFGAETAEELPYKPPTRRTDTDLGEVNARRLARIRQTRKSAIAARRQATARRLAVSLADKADKERKSESAIDMLIHEECEAGQGLRVVAEEFNASARARGGKRGIEAAMQKRGFPRKCQRIEARNGVPCYIGLRWRQ